jgi:hypothetical protein
MLRRSASHRRPTARGLRHVVGLSSATLQALLQRPPADEDWLVMFRVSIGGAEVRPELPLVADVGAVVTWDMAKVG